jgi:hypothetical protein
MKQLLFLSSLGVLFLTSCGAFDFVFTGSKSSANPIQLVFLQTLKSTDFILTMVALDKDNGPNSPLKFDPKVSLAFPLSNQEGQRPLSLSSNIQGNQIYLTRQDRIQIISRETLNTSKDGEALVINPARDQEWIANPTTSSSAPTNCVFKSSQVSNDNRWISALVQCGSPSDNSSLQIWVYSLEQQKEWLKLPNPSPVNQAIDVYGKDTFNKKGFPYVIGENTLYFIKPNIADSTKSDLYTLDLNSSTLSIPSSYKPTSLEGIYSLGVVEKLPVALAITGVKGFTTPSNELSTPLPFINTPTQLWGNINRAGFWGSATDSDIDRKIRFKNTQNNSSSNTSFSVVKDMTFSNDDYAWALTSTSLVRFDVGILNPNSPLSATAIDYTSENFLFVSGKNQTIPFAVTWLLGTSQP